MTEWMIENWVIEAVGMIALGYILVKIICVLYGPLELSDESGNVVAVGKDKEEV
jgi:hypothetical protein